MIPPLRISSVFFFNDTATTEIYTLSLHDALPICFLKIPPPRSASTRPASISRTDRYSAASDRVVLRMLRLKLRVRKIDRKSTRLNSSHSQISYAVFCLKKKKKQRATLRLA